MPSSLNSRRGQKRPHQTIQESLVEEDTTLEEDVQNVHPRGMRGRKQHQKPNAASTSSNVR